MKRKNTKGFTLVELLIVIALIAILSVAVLATINPIEQANKANDSSTQNDAAEVMNAYERYYANKQSYPWMAYGPDPKLTVDDSVMLRSDMVGFGICDAALADIDTTEHNATSNDCDTASTDPGLLIVQDELKPSFVGKKAFTDVGTNYENALITFKDVGSGGSIYVCYVPKAKSNRDSVTNTLWCLDEAGEARYPADGSVDCSAPTTDSTAWSRAEDALAVGNAAEAGIWKCVP
ncbi:MAG: hypothetical protein BWY74_02629 [Firmicutes bacterium ADurb.Bin419]|nr:MAG: hypothetical protein BWY74_02629 [Firmicutes bacterium ADurb.Bin419]